MSNLPDVRKNTSPARPRQTLQGELVNVDLVNQVYDQTGLDQLFEVYARHEGDMYLEDDVAQAFSELAVHIAGMAYNGGNVEVELVRAAFDRTYAGMNLAARQARDLRKNASPLQNLLVKAGVKQPEYHTVVLPLDDKFWNSQFMDQFHNEGQVKRVPAEPEEVYFARYVARCLRGFPWAYFTHAV